MTRAEVLQRRVQHGVGFADEVGRRLAQRAGIQKNVSAHTLRHTCATRLLRRGVSLEHVRKVMRHSDITTTARVYAHLNDHDGDWAIEQLN